MPFGQVRTDLNGPRITATDFGYTGQRDDSDLGLMDYKARMYDAALGRFIQPDTQPLREHLSYWVLQRRDRLYIIEPEQYVQVLQYVLPQPAWLEAQRLLLLVLHSLRPNGF